MTKRVLWAAMGLLLAAAPAAAADAMPMPMHHGAKVHGTQAPEAAENAAAMATMMKEMDVASTGNADKDFARMMLAHHRGAIAMAQVELRHGRDPEMRTLAGEIIKAQEAEIARMQAWLAGH